jgi:hypothetical protein
MSILLGDGSGEKRRRQFTLFFRRRHIALWRKLTDESVMCVLHAQLSAQNETTGSTSTATGHIQIKVWNDGTIEFKAQIQNPLRGRSSRAISTWRRSTSQARS